LIKYVQELFHRGIKTQSDLHDKVLAGLLGFSIGDALGVPVEFKARGQFPKVTGMTGYGTHHQPPGTWSDDSSMTFCLVENLIDGYDLEELKQLFCNWYYYGHWTHNDKLPFDIGQSTSKALSRIKAGVAERESGAKDEKSNGNGSLMRVLPLAFYLRNTDDKTKFNMIEEVSGITHAHIRSKIACSIYVEMAIHLIKGNTPQAAYKNSTTKVFTYYSDRGYKEEIHHFHRIIHHDISSYSIEQIKSSGYVVDTLEASLWSFLNSRSYEEAVLLAVNLGEDTDTIGAITGGLAGIYYGTKAIPRKWIKTLARKNDIIQLADHFYATLL
jgi:ADP-ribosyl-[dinitrogen reductase] hydrolase